MFWLQWFRIAVFSWVILCSLIVLGLGGHITSVTEEYLGSYFIFGALGIATAVLSIATLPTMFLLDFFLSTTPFTSWVMIELIWLSVLWVLWLATAADAASSTSTCSQVDAYTIVTPLIETLKTGCHDSQALEAFAFLAWISLMAYTIALLAMAIMAANRGTSAWTTSVTEFDLPQSSTLEKNTALAPQYPMTTVQGTAAPSTTQDASNPYRNSPASAQQV